MRVGGIGKLLLNSYRAFIGADGKNFKIAVMLAQHHEYNQRTESCPRMVKEPTFILYVYFTTTLKISILVKRMQ